MTVDEAIYCMESYLPNIELGHCLGCPYYGSVYLGDNSRICKSSEAHKLAIVALKKMEEET